jgi:FAD/FMN-containing dehydrogenase
MSGPEVLSPSSYEEAASLVRDAEASGLRLVPSGLGNHLDRAALRSGGGAILSLARLSKVVRYEPGDFTVGVQAGAPLDVIEKTLAEHRQEIPVDAPLAPRGTIGGALAQDRSGPRRARLGTFRHYLIGIAGLRGGGRLYRAGGMVVKNVAGYDVMKLLIGSGGLLGPILEANFKLRAIPAARSARISRFARADAAWRLARSIRELRLDPAALLVLSPAAAAGIDAALGEAPRPAWSVFWLLEGNAGDVRWLEAQADRLLREARPESESTLPEPFRRRALEHLSSLADPRPPEPRSGAVLKLAALPSDVQASGEALEGALRAAPSRSPGGPAGWVVSDVQSGVHLAGTDGGVERSEAGKQREAIEGIVRRHSGTLAVLRAPAGAWDRGGARDVPHPEIQEKVRRVFDPQGVFAGRPMGGRRP